MVRVTTGLDGALYLAKPVWELFDWDAAYEELKGHLHPHGLSCACGACDAIGHGKSKTGYPVYKCRACGKTYSLLTGTPFSGITLDARRLLAFMRMVGEGRSTLEISKEVGLHRVSVDQLVGKVQIYARYSN